MALSPKEERELREIELSLMAADPELAERMHLPHPHRDVLALVGVCLLMSAALITVLAIPEAPVLLVGSVLCVWGAWTCFRLAFSAGIHRS